MYKYFLITAILIFIPFIDAEAQGIMEEKLDMQALTTVIDDNLFAQVNSVPPSVSYLANDGQTEQPYRERVLTLNKLHKYLGIGSITLATLAVLSPKDDEKGPHHYFANGAAAMGGAAVASGLTFHIDDLNHDRGFYRDPDNWHALLGALGAAGFLMAVDAAPGESHAGYGMAGFGSMALSIKLVW